MPKTRNMGFYPAAENDFLTWLDRFAKGASEHRATLGLTVEEAAAIQAQVDAFQSTLVATLAAHQAYKAELSRKETVHGDVKELVSRLNKRFRTRAGVSIEVLLSLGLPKHRPPTKQSARQPIDLVARTDTDGNAKFVFNRNGNPKGTAFIFETRDTEAGPWTFLGVSTSSRVAFDGFSLDRPMFVRVTAQIGKRRSAPSEAFVIFAAPSPVPSRRAA